MTMADKKEEEELELPPEILKLMNNKNYFGQMNDPTSSAYLQGPCGDYMEFYLVIEQQKIIDLKYYTEGCSATRACGAMVAHLSHGKTISEALNISAGDIIKRLKGLPQDHLHCSILSVSTLYRAIADYLLQK